MSTDPKQLEFARGEARSKIQWGAAVQEVEELLQSKYGLAGPEADALLEEALAIRRSLVRKKAGIRLAFAGIGLAVSISYFGIQFFGGFIRIGLGSIAMAALGVVCLAATWRSVAELITGDAPGSVQ